MPTPASPTSAAVPTTGPSQALAVIRREEELDLDTAIALVESNREATRRLIVPVLVPLALGYAGAAAVVAGLLPESGLVTGAIAALFVAVCTGALVTQRAYYQLAEAAGVDPKLARRLTNRMEWAKMTLPWKKRGDERTRALALKLLPR